MRKTILTVLICGLLLMFAGCSGNDDPAVSTAASVPETTTEAIDTTPETLAPPAEELVIPMIYPDVVGLYIPAGDGTSNRMLVTEFSGSRTPKTDIDCFEVIASNAELLEGDSFTGIWRDAWNSHENTENAKIGFHIEFQLVGGETVSKMLLKPSDSQEFFDYIEIYMYDDINQAGGWYTHLEDSGMNEDTIISSIKLHCGDQIGEVDGNIRLTAFIYNGDDCFDSDGDYIGFVFNSVTITE